MSTNVTEHELVFLAAKAADIALAPAPFVHHGPEGAAYTDDGDFFNPLNDDGDALRLAVKLRISIMLAETAPGAPECAYAESLEGGPIWRYVHVEDADLLAATRRAIVHAAAAIGRAMP